MENNSQDPQDDGHVVCDMNRPGMPWYQETKRPNFLPRSSATNAYGDRITKSELRRYTWYAVLGGLAIVAVIAVVWVLLTLFATQVWFR